MSNCLPEKFENFADAKRWREKVIKCIKLHGKEPEDYGLIDCKKDNRCGSGLCPICVGLIRIKFMRFAADNGFLEREWSSITIRFDRWWMEPGDLRPFAEHAGIGSLNELPQATNLIQGFRRRHAKLKAEEAVTEDLIVVGSIETIIRKMYNEFEGKPFHIHLMVSGLPEKDIKRCCVNVEQLPEAIASDYPKSVFVEPVSSSRADIIDSITYAIKQPYWKYSYYGKGKWDRKLQFPNTEELYELVNNYGPHGCTDRWFKIGFECRGRKFRKSKVKSKSDGEKL